MATEAVYGDKEEEGTLLRHDLACFVDEGRTEERRPEYSGAVSKALAKRIRKMMGGDVELSYPILGPDEFVPSAIKEQVHRTGDVQQSKRRGVTASQVVDAVFKSLSLEPELASSRTKTSPVSKGRALSAWLWVERMGRPQIVMADELNTSPEAVTIMLSRLRQKGLTLGEKQRLTRILNKLTKEEASDIEVTEKKKLSKEPRVLILKRQRK